MNSVLFVFILPAASAQSFVCMSGNPRCGTCTNDMDSCQGDTTCEFSMYVLEGFDAGSDEACQAYVEAGKAMGDDVTKDDITDQNGGVPAHAYGITMAIYPDTTGIDKLPMAARQRRLEANRVNGTVENMIPPCSKEALISVVQQSSDFQTWCATSVCLPYPPPASCTPMLKHRTSCAAASTSTCSTRERTHWRRRPASS